MISTLSLCYGHFIQEYVMNVEKNLRRSNGYYISSEMYVIPFGIKIRKWKDKDWKDCEQKIIDVINITISYRFSKKNIQIMIKKEKRGYTILCTPLIF